ncbi:MAG: DUF6259 domain-containing protein [Bacteroidales bacterium]|nr:DUF6259 domain-containing protein [Bacteroidales bacterium]
MNKRNFTTVVLLAAFVFQGIAQNVYTLKNQKIEFSIDNNGNMVTLKNLQTGFNYASGKSIWRLYFDRKNQKDNEILAKDNQPSIRQTENQIFITYNKLTNGKEDLNFKLSLKIVLEENMVRFGSEITNNELHTIIRELQYPLVANCQLPPDHQLLTTETGGKLYPDPKKQILSIPYSYMGPDQHFRQMNVKYPSGVASNCFALVGRNQGLYFGSHDSTFQDTWHGLRMYPDKKHNFSELETGLYKYPNCLSGQSWKNDANVIVPYTGSWHETSKIYRTWANTWWNHSEEPLWIKQMPGFQRIILRHQYGETLFTYNDFATNVKKAGESVGINVVFPFGWWNSGMDNGYPDSYYVTDPDQGGDEGWKKAIAGYQKGGGKVLLYFNGKLIDTESDYYKNGEGKKVCFKSNTGTEIVEAYRFSGPGTFTGYYNARSFVVADTKNPKWEKKLIEMADRTIELGANSVFYDQLGYGENTGNWDISKEFPIPDLRVIADKGNALKMAHDYIDKKDKDLAIGTEHITDVTSQYCDYVHSIFNLKASNCFIDWFRYTFPEIILSDRNIDGDEPDIEWLMNQDVLLGLRNNLQIYRLRATIDKTPDYQQYLAKINVLKDKYKSLLLLGTYRDTEGFSIDDQIIEARSFVNGNQMAIVVTQKSAESATTKLLVPGYRYKESSGVGEVKVNEGTDNTQSVIVGKNSIVVLIYEKMKNNN